MRLTRLPAALVTAGLLAGVASCATTISGSGSIAPDVVAGGPAPTDGSGTSGSESPGSDSPGSTPDSAAPDSTAPGGSDDPSPTPSATVDTVRIKERELCVLERAAIAGINTSFNASGRRSQQIQILKKGAATIGTELSRAGLPGDDGVLRAGTGVHTQLTRIYTAAEAGKTPSTKPYNDATRKFQEICNAVP